MLSLHEATCVQTLFPMCTIAEKNIVVAKQTQQYKYKKEAMLFRREHYYESYKKQVGNQCEMKVTTEITCEKGSIEKKLHPSKQKKVQKTVHAK